jgi:hypothetical protein
MHTPYSFAFLTTKQQIRYLHERGTYAAQRSTAAFSYYLFTLHSYFVEICRERSNEQIIGLHPLPLDLVEVFYADHVSLEALLS